MNRHDACRNRKEYTFSIPVLISYRCCASQWQPIAPTGVRNRHQALFSIPRMSALKILHRCYPPNRILSVPPGGSGSGPRSTLKEVGKKQLSRRKKVIDQFANLLPGNQMLGGDKIPRFRFIFIQDFQPFQTLLL